MPGFDNNTMYADNVDFSGSVTPTPQVTTNGQLLIGSTAAPNIRVGTLTSTGGSLTITTGAGTINLETAGGGIPVDTVTVQAATAPGVTNVTPTAAGVITVSGAAVAAHSVPIETHSRALNAYNVEVQYSAAVAATDATKSGLAHFNSAMFTVDASGFVALAGGGQAIDSINVDATSGGGTDPVLPDATGLVTITGGQIATGTIGANVIRSISTAANSLTVQIQQTDSVAAKDTTKNGVAHFNSTYFTDDEGFVSLVTPVPGGGAWTQIESQTPAGAATVVFNTSLTSYTELLFLIDGITCSSNFFQVEASADNGSTQISCTNNGGFLSAAPAATTATGTVVTISSNSVNQTLTGSVSIQNFSSTSRRRLSASIFESGAAADYQFITEGLFASASQINWVRFSPGAGTISGTIVAWGR